MNLSLLFVTVLIPGQAAPQFEIQSTGDKPLVQAIAELANDGALTLADGTTVPREEIVAVRRLALPLPAWPRSAHVVLHNGDRLAGAPTRFADAMLYFQAQSIRGTDDKVDGALRIPITAVAHLWRRAIDASERRCHEALFAADRDADLVLLENGDVVAGAVTAIDMKKGELTIENGKESRALPWTKTVGIAFGTKLARSRKPSGPYSHLVLTNGTRLAITSPAIQKGLLTGTTLYRDRIEVRLVDLAALDVYQGRAVYLSDLKPAKYQYRTYQGEEFSWTGDRDLEGGELRIKSPLGAQTYDKGLAVHGECTLEYSLEGNYQRFESVIGLDPRLGERGSVVIQILVDGKEQPIGDGKPLTVDRGPWRAKIDVRGAKTLTLKVLWGEGGNVGDYVNWGDARLIR